MTYTKEQAKQTVKELVERFRRNLDVYKKSTYNETQVRQEFINPFFEALEAQKFQLTRVLIPANIYLRSEIEMVKFPNFGNIRSKEGKMISAHPK